jgi:hypothetical protein
MFGQGFESNPGKWENEYQVLIAVTVAVLALDWIGLGDMNKIKVCVRTL